MKVSQLVEELMEMPDLRVMIFAYRGQNAEVAYCVQEMVDQGRGEIADPEDLIADGWDQKEVDELERVIVVFS